MNRYTIDCTQEQIRMALELGAKPEIIDSQERVKKNIERIRDTYGIHSCEYKNATYYLVEVRYKNNPKIVVVNQVVYRLPTAEQMIGWLRDKDLSVEVMNVYQGGKKWISTIWNIKETQLIKETIEFDDYKEATLAAIDAALEYLSKKGE